MKNTPNLDDYDQEISDYVVINRKKLMREDGTYSATLRMIAECSCIRRNIKAITDGDPAGAHNIVLSEKLMKDAISNEQRAKIFEFLQKLEAIIPNSVVEFSTDITQEERMLRTIFKSKYERFADESAFYRKVSRS